MLIITNIEYLDKTHVHCSGLFELKSNKDVQARLNHISFNQTHPIIIVGDSRGYIQVCFYSIFHIFQTNISGIFTKLCIEIILKWIQTCHVWAGRHLSSQHTNNHSCCWTDHLIITNIDELFIMFFNVQCLKLSPNLRRQRKEVKLWSFDNYLQHHDHHHHHDYPQSG